MDNDRVDRSIILYLLYAVRLNYRELFETLRGRINKKQIRSGVQILAGWKIKPDVYKQMSNEDDV